MSNYVLNNRWNFHLQLLRRFKDIAVFVVGSFSLPHPIHTVLQNNPLHNPENEFQL